MGLRMDNDISPCFFAFLRGGTGSPGHHQISFNSAYYHDIFVGKPAAVSNLTSANLTGIICLTWEGPFTLDITGVDPDILYNISVVAVADSNDSPPLTGNFSVDAPEFNFTMDYPGTSTSVIYEFRVIPRNGAGEGPTSAPVSGFFSGRELWWSLFYRTDRNGMDRFCHIILRNGTTCAYIVYCIVSNISDKKLLIGGAILEYTRVQNLCGHFA